MKQCFECETTEDLQEHHVVPRSRAGTKTVTLCYQCHMKAHGRSGKGQDHRELTKQGMKTALERRRLKNPDYKFGNPEIEKAREKSIEVRMKKADEKALEFFNLVSSLYEQNGSYTRTAKELNKLGIKTQRGKKWYPSTVSNILKRYETLELK